MTARATPTEETRAQARTLGRAWPALPVWLAVGLLPAAGGVVAQPGAWYAALAKPEWTPPPWLFGPVWTLLYLSLGLAAWGVWRRGGLAAHRGAFALFALQHLLNALWSPLFFGLHAPLVALVDLVLLVAAAAATAVAFGRVVRWSGLVLVPYLAWLLFAASLNAAIWNLARGG